CITSMTSEPKCFHSAKWWRTCGRLVGFATCLRCLGPMQRSAGGRRFPVKCDNGLLCDLRTRSTEAVAGPCYVRRSLTNGDKPAPQPSPKTPGDLREPC